MFFEQTGICIVCMPMSMVSPIYAPSEPLCRERTLAAKVLTRR